MGTDAFRDADELGTYVETVWAHTLHPAQLYGLSASDAISPQKFLKMSAWLTTLVTFAVGVFMYGETKLVDFTTWGSLVIVQCLLTSAVIAFGAVVAAVMKLDVALSDLYKAFCYSSWWLCVAAPLSVALVRFEHEWDLEDWQAISLFVGAIGASVGFFVTVTRGMAAAAHTRGKRAVGFAIVVSLLAIGFNAWTTLGIRRLGALGHVSPGPPLGFNASPSHGGTISIRNFGGTYDREIIVEPGETFELWINLEKHSPGPAENVYVALTAPPFVSSTPLAIGVDIQGDARNDHASGSVTVRCPYTSNWLGVRYVGATYFRRGDMEQPVPFPNGQDGSVLLSEKGLFVGKLDSGQEGRQGIRVAFRVDPDPAYVPPRRR